MAKPLPYFAECPHCKEVVRLDPADKEHDLSIRRSGWTDGKGLKWDFGMRSGFGADELYRGYSCGQFFWFSEAVHVPERTRGLPAQVVAKDRGILQRALENNCARTREQRVWIRTRILWLDNDPIRLVTSEQSHVRIHRASVTYSLGFKGNVGKLMELLNPEEPRELILLADLFRQCGAFDQTVGLLKNIAGKLYNTQQQEAAEERQYNEQFRSETSTGVTDFRPRVEPLIFLARFIVEHALDRDPLVRPFQQHRVAV